jgi:hypothetical protein
MTLFPEVVVGSQFWIMCVSFVQSSKKYISLPCAHHHFISLFCGLFVFSLVFKNNYYFGKKKL